MPFGKKKHYEGQSERYTQSDQWSALLNIFTCNRLYTRDHSVFTVLFLLSQKVSEIHKYWENCVELLSHNLFHTTENLLAHHLTRYHNLFSNPIFCKFFLKNIMKSRNIWSVRQGVGVSNVANQVLLQWRIQDFPGAPTYYFTNFSPKLHENEEILDRGSRTSLAPPRSATVPLRLGQVRTLVSELDTPRPLAELRESPERTHEVIVSGAMTFSSCVPSDLSD